MRLRFPIVMATVVAAALALAQTPEPRFTVTLAGGATTRATLAVRYSPDGGIDAATVTIARPEGKKRDQSRVSAEELLRTPGVLTPVKLFVTETWEGGTNPFDVGEKRNVVLSGFWKESENVSIERLADDAQTGGRVYKLDGPWSHWNLTTDGKRLISFTGTHGVTIRREL
jgi:hypothetical protein